MKVIFEFPDGKTAETEAYEKLNLLAHAQLVERSVQSRCGGHCECGTCRVTVRTGRVSIMKDSERELLERAGAAAGTRLACQSFPEKDGASDKENVVTVVVPAERFVDARSKAMRR